MPELVAGNEHVALTERAHAQRDHPCAVPGHGRIDRRTAFRAEGLFAPVAAVAGLDISAGRAGQEAERARERRDDRPERRACEGLAVAAVADHNPAAIDVGLVSDAAAMAGAIDLHAPLR